MPGKKNKPTIDLKGRPVRWYAVTTQTFLSPGLNSLRSARRVGTCCAHLMKVGEEITGFMSHDKKKQKSNTSLLRKQQRPSAFIRPASREQREALNKHPSQKETHTQQKRHHQVKRNIRDSKKRTHHETNNENFCAQDEETRGKNENAYL